MICGKENSKDCGADGFAPEPGAVLVSVIIPFYKGKDFLAEAVKSAAEQSEKNIEIIVINDGSPENIGDIIESFKSDRRVCFKTQINKGAAAARNLGIELAKGEYIAFLDADDIWAPNKLQAQLDFMRKTGRKWAHCAYNRFVDGNRGQKKYFPCKIWGDVYPLILFWCPLATPCIMAKREIFEDKTLRFAEGKSYGEDSALWRAIGEKYNLGYLPEPLVEVRLRVLKNKIGNAAYRAEVQMSERANFLKSWRFAMAHSNPPVFLAWLLPTLISRAGISLYRLFSKCFRGENAKEIFARFLYLPSYAMFKAAVVLLRPLQKFNPKKS